MFRTDDTECCAGTQSGSQPGSPPPYQKIFSIFADVGGILIDLCDNEEVPHLNLVLKELPSPGVLHPDPVLEDAHVLLCVAVNGKVHEAHLDTKVMSFHFFHDNSRPGYQMDRREGQTRTQILGNTLAQGLWSFWMNQSCSLKINF